MMESIVRMVDFKITNFKNVNNGSLNLINKRKDFSSSILGLYGQNGSGKTALIDAFQILKLLLCGRQVPDKYADYINVNSDCSKFHFHFQIDAGNNGTYEVYYDFSLKAAKSIVEPNMPIGDTATTIKAQIYDEVISYNHLFSQENFYKIYVIRKMMKKKLTVYILFINIFWTDWFTMATVNCSSLKHPIAEY